MRKKYPAQLIKFGEKIKSLRIENELTQEQLAAKCGVSRRTILRIESGEFPATLHIVFALAEVFKLTASDILNGIRKETNNKKLK